MGGKLKFSAQGSNLAHFVGNGTKIKIHSEIKPPDYSTIRKSLTWSDEHDINQG